MAKGKKKGGGKSTGVEASVSSLNIADSGASTSTSQAPAEEESVGLTGSGKTPKKVVEKSGPVEIKKDDTPLGATASSSAAPPAKPDPPKATPEEEESVGLGLTGSKKSRSRKKKPSLAAQATQPAQPSAQAAQPAQPSAQAAQPVAQPVGQPIPQQPIGGPASFPQPGPYQARQPVPQPGVGPASFPRQAEPAGPQRGWPAPAATASSAPWQRPALPPQQASVPTRQATGPSSGGPPQSRPEPSFPPGPPQSRPGPSFPPGPPQSRPGPSFPPGPPQSRPGPSFPPGPPQSRPGPSFPPGPPQSRPGPSHAPGPSGDRPVSYEPLPKSRQEQICRYVIPAKILGKSVPFRPVKVITNYLPMNIKPIKVHRYDVQFKPDKPRKMIPAVYKIVKDKIFPNEFIAFDMVKNAYSLNLLKKNLIEDSTASEDDGRKVHAVEIKDQNGKVMKFSVSFKYTGSVDFSKIIRHMETQGSSLAVPMEEVQCMDVVLRQGTLEAYVKVGRNFFKRPDRPIDLSGGLEMWTGLFQSAIFTSRPYINVDVAHKGFPIHQPMLKAWTSMGLDLNRGIEQQYGRGAETFKEFLKGLKVICKMVGGVTDGENREFIVNGIKERPTQLTFSKDTERRPVTVYDYFLKEKKYKIQYPHLPCLWVGSRDKNIFYPLELCTVGYGQPLKKQLNEFQLSTMVREAATPPDERKRKIEEVARNMNYSQNAFFKKFGLEISDQFLEVEAKVLQAPGLNCGEGRPVNPMRGVWNSQKLLKPEALVSWGFIGIELSPNLCNYEYIAQLLSQTGSQLGMQVAKPKINAFNVNMNELRALLFKALEQEVRFLFIIVPTRGKDYYHKVKQFAECDVGILTQCIREQTATRRMNHQTIKNILLKVNSKLMGINQCLDNRSIPRCITAGNVMVVGADVTHPSPEQQNIPSIAAVTASIDPNCFIYNIELSIQSPKEEVISQYEDMMYDHLKVYIQRNGRPPKKIYVFRDGVAEGQFGQVMNKELTGLLNAYARFSKEKPEVLFLLVQKRHHTRLFGTDYRTRKIINVEPGTVVDTHIVHPKELDFYLVSHAAIKGTARPTRYHSVCNDGGVPHDEIEQLTYYLCHLYSRCMRAVSYPTPTYYAHLACLRARSLTHGATYINKDLEGKPQRLRVCDKMLRSSRMFFV